MLDKRKIRSMRRYEREERIRALEKRINASKASLQYLQTTADNAFRDSYLRQIRTHESALQVHLDAIRDLQSRIQSLPDRGELITRYKRRIESYSEELKAMKSAERDKETLRQVKKLSDALGPVTDELAEFLQDSGFSPDIAEIMRSLEGKDIA